MEVEGADDNGGGGGGGYGGGVGEVGEVLAKAGEGEVVLRVHGLWREGESSGIGVDGVREVVCGSLGCFLKKIKA